MTSQPNALIASQIDGDPARRVRATPPWRPEPQNPRVKRNRAAIVAAASNSTVANAPVLER